MAISPIGCLRSLTVLLEGVDLDCMYIQKSIRVFIEGIWCSVFGYLEVTCERMGRADFIQSLQDS